MPRRPPGSRVQGGHIERAWEASVTLPCGRELPGRRSCRHGTQPVYGRPDKAGPMTTTNNLIPILLALSLAATSLACPTRTASDFDGSGGGGGSETETGGHAGSSPTGTGTGGGAGGGG